MLIEANRLIILNYFSIHENPIRISKIIGDLYAEMSEDECKETLVYLTQHGFIQIDKNGFFSVTENGKAYVIQFESELAQINQGRQLNKEQKEEEESNLKKLHTELNELHTKFYDSQKKVKVLQTIIALLTFLAAIMGVLLADPVSD